MSTVHVLVTNSRRLVLLGEISSELYDSLRTLPESLTLFNAQQCFYWHPDTKGFLSLAARGPANGSRVGYIAPEITIGSTTDPITSVTRCSDSAVSAWRAYDA